MSRKTCTVHRGEEFLFGVLCPLCEPDWKDKLEFVTESYDGTSTPTVRVCTVRRKRSAKRGDT